MKFINPSNSSEILTEQSIYCLNLRRSRDCFLPLSFGLLSFVFVTQLRYADKRIHNKTKVYIERNNLQLNLIWYHKNCLLYSHLVLRNDRVQCNIVHRLDTEIFTGNTSLFAIWQQVLLPCISEHFEHKLWSLSFLNGKRGL